MKIKQRKYLSEKEALNWLVENSETLLGIEFEKNAYGDKFFGCDFRYDERLGRTEDGRYYITEEVEIDEDTKIDLMAVTNGKGCYTYQKNSINGILAEDNGLFEEHQTKFIYLQNPDGSIGELIWSKERGLL